SVQRGSIKYTFHYPGDPTTPGVASLPDLPSSARIPPEKAEPQPHVPTMPISYGDAQLILDELGGPETPRDWQGGLPFTYHVGPGPMRVHMRIKMSPDFRTIWNVTGTLRGQEAPQQMVIAGNHRDAWVYGAVDPGSGTAAMLEAARGLGALARQGWRPKRTIVFASWDGEEQGMIGSTEWVEAHASQLDQAPAYFNLDVAVAGPLFGASAVPSLKQFVREASKSVPSPSDGTLYEAWQRTSKQGPETRRPAVPDVDVPVGELGSGSDFSAFLQHAGVPSADM